MDGLHVLRDVRSLRLEAVLVGDVGEGDELTLGRGPAVLAGDGVGLLVAAELLDGAGLASAAAVVSLEPVKVAENMSIVALLCLIGLQLESSMLFFWDISTLRATLPSGILSVMWKMGPHFISYFRQDFKYKVLVVTNVIT